MQKNRQEAKNQIKADLKKLFGLIAFWVIGIHFFGGLLLISSWIIYG